MSDKDSNDFDLYELLPCISVVLSEHSCCQVIDNSKPSSLIFFSQSPKTACQPGTYGIDGQCVPCPIGQFHSGGQWCLLCPLGTYEDGTGSSQCKQCPLGMFQDEIGSSQCKQCLPGTYEDGTGSSLCKQCPPGTYQDETGSNQCKQCPPGTYQDETGSSQCKQCLPGTYEPHHAQTSAGEIPNNLPVHDLYLIHI